MRDTLSKLAKGNEHLNLAYEQILHRIDEQEDDYKDIAHRIVSFLVHSCRLPTVLELEHALCLIEYESLDHSALVDVRDLTPVCAGLITVGADGLVRFTHYTTHSYLHNARTRLYPDGDFFIAKACVQYLLDNLADVSRVPSVCDWIPYGSHIQEERWTGVLKDLPFLVYASRQWAYHASQVLDAETRLPRLLDLVHLHPELLERAAWCIWDCHHWARGSSLLTIAAFFGFQGTVRTLLQQSMELKDDDTRHCVFSPLFAAVAGDHVGIVRLLLSHGVNASPVGKKGRTPLCCAVERRSSQIVALLLEHGADMNYDYRATAMDYALAMDDEDESVEEFGKVQDSAHIHMTIGRHSYYDGLSSYCVIPDKATRLGPARWYEGRWEIAQMVLNHPSADMETHGLRLLEFAAQRGNPLKIRELLFARVEKTMAWQNAVATDPARYTKGRYIFEGRREPTEEASEDGASASTLTG